MLESTWRPCGRSWSLPQFFLTSSTMTKPAKRRSRSQEGPEGHKCVSSDTSKSEMHSPTWKVIAVQLCRGSLRPERLAASELAFPPEACQLKGTKHDSNGIKARHDVSLLRQPSCVERLCLDGRYGHWHPEEGRGRMLLMWTTCQHDERNWSILLPELM